MGGRGRFQTCPYEYQRVGLDDRKFRFNVTLGRMILRRAQDERVVVAVGSLSGDGVAVGWFCDLAAIKRWAFSVGCGWTQYQAWAFRLAGFAVARVSGRCQCAAGWVRMVVCPVFPVAHRGGVYILTLTLALSRQGRGKLAARRAVADAGVVTAISVKQRRTSAVL